MEWNSCSSTELMNFNINCNGRVSWSGTLVLAGADEF